MLWLSQSDLVALGDKHPNKAALMFLKLAEAGHEVSWWWEKAQTLFSWLVEATLLLLSHIFIYFLPLVDWYCLRPFNNREIEDWRPSVLGYCLLQDISPNMFGYTLSIDAYIRWHLATLRIWISEARSLRWMSRICSIVAMPIYFLRTKAKLDKSDSKFAALSPGCKLFSVRMKRLDLLILNFMWCHLLESFHLFFHLFPTAPATELLKCPM